MNLQLLLSETFSFPSFVLLCVFNFVSPVSFHCVWVGLTRACTHVDAHKHMQMTCVVYMFFFIISCVLKAICVLIDTYEIFKKILYSTFLNLLKKSTNFILLIPDKFTKLLKSPLLFQCLIIYNCISLPIVAQNT